MKQQIQEAHLPESSPFAFTFTWTSSVCSMVAERDAPEINSKWNLFLKKLIILSKVEESLEKSTSQLLGTLLFYSIPNGCQEKAACSASERQGPAPSRSVYNGNSSGLRNGGLSGSVFWAWILTDCVTQIWVTKNRKAPSSNRLLGCCSKMSHPAFGYPLFSKAMAETKQRPLPHPE